MMAVASGFVRSGCPREVLELVPNRPGPVEVGDDPFERELREASSVAGDDELELTLGAQFAWLLVS
jgi:hypothetical protein